MTSVFEIAAMAIAYLAMFDGLSPFRPCGRDLAEFFKSTG
jgi:hypothetical protein